MAAEQHSQYFEKGCGILEAGFSLRETLSAIACRYIGQNPPEPFHFRVFRTDAFLADHAGWYSLDLKDKLPLAQDGQHAFAATVFRKSAAESHTIMVRCLSRTEIVCNGASVWKSATAEENDDLRKTGVALACREGWNTLLICCRKTASGFGCLIGCEPPQWNWLTFLAPFSNRFGQGGWIYSQAFCDPTAILGKMDLMGKEEDTGLAWYPPPEADSREVCDFGQVYGSQAEAWAYAWTRIVQHRQGLHSVTISCGGAECFLNGESVSKELHLPYGEHDLLLLSRCPQQGEWKSALSAAYNDGEQLELRVPHGVMGTEHPFLYLGPFHQRSDITFHPLKERRMACMAYKLIIVDDEKEISAGFAQFFPWSTLGFEVAAYFTEGQEAFDYLMANPVDVVVSDVIMPGLSGLDLAKLISETPFDVPPHVLLFSAHDKFEYARKALKYRCTDYVLKSSEFDELIDIFTGLKVRLDSERAAQQESKQAADGDVLPLTARNDSVIATIAAYVEEDPAKANLEDAAGLVCMSPAYVSHYFKQKTGQSFSDYLWSRKMHLASRMLLDIQYKIYEIGDRLGYKNSANFTRSFKKFFNMSPKEYRYRKTGRILPEDEEESL